MVGICRIFMFFFFFFLKTEIRHEPLSSKKYVCDGTF